MERKVMSGDIAPKPASNTLFSLMEEGAAFAMKASPIVMRAVNSPASLTLGIATCTFILILDDTTRNLFMDQISHVMAMFQNEATESGNEPSSNRSPKIEP